MGAISHGGATGHMSSPIVAAPAKATSSQAGRGLEKMMQRKSAGSLNLVKHIVDSSLASRGLINQSDQYASRNRLSTRLALPQGRTKPAETFESLKRRLLPQVPEREEPAAKDYIVLGLQPVALDAVSSEVYRAELNKLRYASQVQKAGGHAAHQSAIRQQRLATISSSQNAQPGNAATRQEESVSKVAGRNDAEIKRLLEQGSSNRRLVDSVRDEALSRRMDQLEQIDQMEVALSAQHEQACVLFICVQCQTKTPMRPRMCVAEGHRIDSINGFKRFFRCLKCSQRTTTYERYPAESCAKCGACVYEKTGKLKEREVNEEKLLVHGSEKRFINN